MGTGEGGEFSSPIFPFPMYVPALVVGPVSRLLRGIVERGSNPVAYSIAL